MLICYDLCHLTLPNINVYTRHHIIKHVRHTEESHVIISKHITFLSLKIDFVFAKNVDPDEIPQWLAFSWDCFSYSTIYGYFVFERLKTVELVPVIRVQHLKLLFYIT